MFFLIIGWIVYGFIFHKQQTPEEFQLQMQQMQNKEVLELLPKLSLTTHGYSEVIENLGSDWFVVEITSVKMSKRQYLLRIWRNPTGAILSMSFSEIELAKSQE